MLQGTVLSDVLTPGQTLGSLILSTGQRVTQVQHQKYDYIQNIYGNTISFIQNMTISNSISRRSVKKETENVAATVVVAAAVILWIKQENKNSIKEQKQGMHL